MAKVTLFSGIDEIVTLKKAFLKQGRNICSEDLSIVKEGAILISAGKIIWVGKRKNFSFGKHAAKFKRLELKEIKLDVATVLPTFTECHTHTVFAGNRAKEFELRNNGMSYSEIARRGGGILSTVKSTRRASEKELVTLAQKRVNNFSQQGVGALEIKSGYGLSHASELKMLRVINKLKGPQIIPTYLGLHAVPPEKSLTKYYLEVLNKTLPQIKNEKLCKRVDIFIEKGFYNLNLGKEFLLFAQELGFEACIHADQLNRSGATALAVKLGANSVEHIVSASKNDLAKLADSEVTAVLLPTADFYLKMP